MPRLRIEVDPRKGPAIARKETGVAAPVSVDAYLAALPTESRAALDELRKTVRAAAPEATETIAYGMPALRDRGVFPVSYAATRTTTASFP